jgi:hypothetical protein
MIGVIVDSRRFSDIPQGKSFCACLWVSPNALLAFQMNRLAQGARDSSESINHFFYPHWITFANSSGGELLVAIDPNFST